MDPAQQSTPTITLDQRTRILLEAPVLPMLLKLAAPNMLVMLAQMSTGLVEIYFVARLGVDALAGASLVFPVLSLITAVSQGAVGGGVVATIARALGRGQQAQANQLVWYAVAIAVFFGLLTSSVILSVGPLFYRAMGAEGASLAVATTYSSMVFGGAIVIWVFNLLLAAVRGTGNLLLPVAIVCGGVLILLPLSPMLIFGLGPLPAFGIAGAAAAVLLYYAGGSLCLALYLWGGGGILRPSARPPRLTWAPFREILRVGGMSALVSATTNLTIAIITAYVGTAGVAALAGYGAGARLEFILVPLSYGIGGPAGILIGTNIGAGQGGRAGRTAWITVLLAALATEAVGLAAATWPAAWIGSFSGDPAVLAIGTTYLRTVGPFFGFFGIGYALYCVGQATGRMGWPVAGAVTRAAIAVVGGAAAIRLGANLDHLFSAVSLGMTSFGLFSLPGLFLRSAYGIRQRISAARGPNCGLHTVNLCSK
ncbi:MAG: family efflux transporter [Rhodospirillales bacterium]|nr:family efflux transporter [Rhodospirillales bacterium]